MDKGHKSGKCPELIVKRKGDTKITSILLDTGAETNILGVETLEQVLKVSRENISPLGYQLSLHWFEIQRYSWTDYSLLGFPSRKFTKE